jgi:Holliday junction resolvasome RuvABC endonuclease subunit
VAEPLILAVDPGARETGIVLVEGDRLLAHAVVRRASGLDEGLIEGEYLRKVTDRLIEMARLLDDERTVVAVEAVEAPNPHLGMTNAAGQIATAAVAGAVAGWAVERGLEVVVVSPARHGSSSIRAYPKELQGSREGPAATGILRHCRSAYDVALAARWWLKIKSRNTTP